MNLCNKIIGLLFIGVISLNSKAQDINFSQFYEMPLLRNPALAGIIEGNSDIRLTAAYRNQWQSVTVPYQTMALDAELRTVFGVDNDNFLTTGLIVTNDQAGDSKLKKTQVLPVLNYLRQIGGYERSSFLGVAIMGGPVQQNFDPSKLYFDDQFVNGSYSAANPTIETFSNTNFTYTDLSAGISYKSEFATDIHYYLGLGVYHIIQPKIAFMKQNGLKLNRKYILNFGLTTPTSDFDEFTIYGDFFNQGGNNLFQGGFLFSHDFEQGDLELDERKSITGGVFYRWNDAVVPVVKLKLNQIAIGVSYDINVSKLSVASKSMGGLEVTVSYKNILNIRNRDLQATRCPSWGGHMPKVF